MSKKTLEGIVGVLAVVIVCLLFWFWVVVTTNNHVDMLNHQMDCAEQDDKAFPVETLGGYVICVESVE